MADPASATPTVLLPADQVAATVETLADRIAPVVDDETVAMVLLTGGLWFGADLTRALARRGKHLRFDALWLASYGDGTTSRSPPGRTSRLGNSCSSRRPTIISISSARVTAASGLSPTR